MKDRIFENGLFTGEEFIDAKKLWTLQGINGNSSSDKSELSDPDLSGLEREKVVPVFWLKFQDLLANYFQNIWKDRLIKTRRDYND